MACPECHLCTEEGKGETVVMEEEEVVVMVVLNAETKKIISNKCYKKG